MIIINLTGGLGNQMFQYAFGRYLSIKHKTNLKYHFTNALFNTQRNFNLDVFNIEAANVSSQDLKKYGIIQDKLVNRILYLLDERYNIQFNHNIITQPFPHSFDSLLRAIPDNRYIQGYFADERYFKGIEDILKKEFTPRKNVTNQNLNIIKQMQKTNSISIHVRRTDYLTHNSYNSQFIGLDYYTRAVKQIIDSVKNPTFFIFSDDMNWCRLNFKDLKNAYFVENNRGLDSYLDMILMSNCKHNINANSTFSEWGSWLNGNHNKIVIRP